MRNKEGYTQIESFKAFENSAIWDLQRNYYINQGIDAWASQVPFYITSNAYFATQYAKMIIELIQDGFANGTYDINKPIYILELGAGSGKFGFFFVKELIEFQNMHTVDKTPEFKYVMTDLCEKNISFWNTHHQLKKHIDKGILDTAFFDADSCNEIKLNNSKKTIKPNSLDNPPIVIGNYFLDTIRCNLLHFRDGEIEQVDLSLQTPTANLKDPDNPKEVIDLKQVEIAYELSDFDVSKVTNNNLLNVLEYYQNNVENGRILIPTAAFNVVDYFKSLHKKQQAFFFFSDKGHLSLSLLDYPDDPHIAYHGSISLMFNFHALKYYVNQDNENDALLPNRKQNLNLVSLGVNNSFTNFTSFKKAYWDYTDYFTVTDFMSLSNNIINNAQNSTLDELIALMRMTHWEPNIFYRISGLLHDKIEENDTVKIKRCIPYIEENFYFLPNKKSNIVFELARLSYLVYDYDYAITMFEKSMDLYGQSSNGLFNLGLSYFYNDNKTMALDTFKRCLVLDPNDKEIIEFIDRCREEFEAVGIES